MLQLICTDILNPSNIHATMNYQNISVIL